MKKLHTYLGQKMSWYQKYHMMPYHSALHVIMLIIFILGVSSTPFIKSYAAPICTPLTTPYITVIYPNGGEIFVANQQITVTWTSCNIPNTDKVKIYIWLNGTFAFPQLVSPTLGTGLLPNSGSAIVILPDPMTVPVWTTNVSVGQASATYGQHYKVMVSDQFASPGSLGQGKFDLSDNLFTINNTCGVSNTWTQKANFGAPTATTNTTYTTSFSIGTKGYIGTGMTNDWTGGPEPLVNDFWEYNQVTNTWTQKANFGGVPRIGAVGFSIGAKGYIGTGATNTTGHKNDFWEYDPATNTWTQKTNVPGTPRAWAVGFSIGTKGYIGGAADGPAGGSLTSTSVSDFYEYNPSTNTWTQKANIGGGWRQSGIGFSIGSKGYVGMGTKVTNAGFVYGNTDFWEYNPATDVWTVKASLITGTPRVANAGFSMGGKGYVYTAALGNTPHNSSDNNFWEYNPVTNVWAPKANFVNIDWYGQTGFSIGNKGYLGAGLGTGPTQPSFYEYCQ